MTSVIFLAAIFLFLIIYVGYSVRIIRPYQLGVVERLGKYKMAANPGLRFIIPFVDRIRLIDMREQVVDVPPQEVITADNVVVSVDAVLYYEPVDAQRLLYNVANFLLAVTKLAQTNLRNLIGELQLDQVLISRESINTSLRTILDEATDTWGVRVKRVEIQRIDPPVDVMAAMHEQMKAERTRRATVTTAEGEREAAITRAEGQRQSVILAAEGMRQQQILEAEGQAAAVRELAEADRFRQQTTALGEAEAIRTVYAAIHDGNPTPDLVAIKYLEALAKIADGQATKIFLPTDSTAAMGSLAGIAELFRGNTTPPATPAE